jgi:hypothetical protein
MRPPGLIRAGARRQEAAERRFAGRQGRAPGCQRSLPPALRRWRIARMAQRWGLAAGWGGGWGGPQVHMFTCVEPPYSPPCRRCCTPLLHAAAVGPAAPASLLGLVAVCAWFGFGGRPAASPRRRSSGGLSRGVQRRVSRGCGDRGADASVPVWRTQDVLTSSYLRPLNRARARGPCGCGWARRWPSRRSKNGAIRPIL